MTDPVVNDRIQYLNTHKVKEGVLLATFWNKEVFTATVELKNGAFVTLPYNRLQKLHEPVRCDVRINLWGVAHRCEKDEHGPTISHQTTYSGKYGMSALNVKWSEKEIGHS